MLVALTDFTLAMPLQALILAVVAVAALTDLRRRKIYNVLTFPTMALGLVVNTWSDGLTGLLVAVTGLLLGGALFILPVAAGGRGAGDLKLLAALGALGGPAFVFWCALFTSIAGGILALIVLLVRRRFVAVAGGMVMDLYTQQAPRMDSNIHLPYAVSIAAGTVAALLVVA